jgi:PPK2 family polyphosphate:nucleotide phosphotransferase
MAHKKSRPQKAATGTSKGRRDAHGKVAVRERGATGGAAQVTDAIPGRGTGEALMLPLGTVDLSSIDPRAKPVGPRDKREAARLIEEMAPELASLQERLFAAAVAGGTRRVLLVLQGMDTSGKDGVVKHVLGLVNPAGVRLVSFKQPTEEERSHDFLWRIEQQVPHAGQIGVFNRSHYEDVLVVRVHELVPEDEWSSRYDRINDFEQGLVHDGTVLVKCFLHISKKAQRERLLARLDDPTKYWKYNPDDVDERGYWDAYQQAYADALGRCNTLVAPWFVVPSDRKWYRNWAVASLLLQTLRQIDPQYPPAAFDVEFERQRVAGS